jgi:hypothetical protein
VIDFRFFLISIVAVFLALGIGIVMGSGVLGGPILEGLEQRAQGAIERSDELENEIDQLDARVDDAVGFAEAAEPLLVDGVLTGRGVVVFEVEGSDGTLFDGIERTVEEAGGSIVSRITLSVRFSLESAADRRELSAILGLGGSGADSLRADAGAALGTRSGAAAAQPVGEPRPGFAAARLNELLAQLEDSAYVSVENPSAGPLVPPGAAFVVTAGGTEEPPYDPTDLVLELGMGLDAQGATTVLAETSDDPWGLVASARDDEDAAQAISTVDNAETIFGRVAVAMGLDRDASEEAEQLGTADGATAPLPSPD